VECRGDMEREWNGETDGEGWIGGGEVRAKGVEWRGKHPPGDNVFFPLLNIGVMNELCCARVPRPRR